MLDIILGQTEFLNRSIPWTFALMPNSKNEFLMIFIGEPAGEVILKSPFELFTMIFRHS